MPCPSDWDGTRECELLVLDRNELDGDSRPSAAEMTVSGDLALARKERLRERGVRRREGDAVDVLDMRGGGVEEDGGGSESFEA